MMEVPKLIIKKTDLLGDTWYFDDLPEEFDAIEEIRKRGNYADDVAYLIHRCPKARNKEILDYFMSRKPKNFELIGKLMVAFEFAQTQEMLDLYKASKPFYGSNFYWVLKSCKIAQTEEMLDFFISLKPDYNDVASVIQDCKFAQTKKMFDYYKSLKPDFNSVYDLWRLREFYIKEEFHEYLYEMLKSYKEWKK